MAKPVILTVDDDPDVLRAIERDLRQRYRDQYRVLRAESGIAALDLLRRLQQRNDAIALLLIDHRMPEMNGVETLVQAGCTTFLELGPGRVLGGLVRQINPGVEQASVDSPEKVKAFADSRSG